jgi:hypothetical protein
MKSNTLFRIAGLSLALGGMLGPLGHLVLHPPSHALEYQGTSQWIVAHAVLTLSWILILFGLFGLYGYLHQRMGLIGLLGFVLLSVLCLQEVATFAFDAFTLPAIKTTFPGEVATAPNGSFQQFPNGPLLGFLGFGDPIGLILFGVAIFRSRFAQRWAGIALAASVLLILGGISLGHSPLHLDRAIPIVFSINSLVFAWIGFGLLQATLERPQPAASVQALVPGAAPGAR